MKCMLFALACAGMQLVAMAAGPLSGSAPGPEPAASALLPMAGAQRVLDAAAKPAAAWSGPRSGPRAQPGKHIAVVGEDLRNGGILGVAQGVREAAKVIGWNVSVFDCGGTVSGRRRALADALAKSPDGLLLIGPDAHAIQAALLPFKERGVPIVGWHVAPTAGPVAGTPVAMNVSTDPLEVARVTALAAIVQSKGQAGVVVFTDTSLELPKTKANAMADVVRACKGCTLLEITDVAISRNPELMPQTTRDLLARHGKRWTHALAINDIYFDYATPVLTQAGLANDAISMLSAGDGSAAAFLRIKAGTFQSATVAEPLNLHGWQLIDEMNRLLAKQPVTGFVFPVHLVTPANIDTDGGDRLMYDPANGYRDIYKRIWQRG
ncbi:MAG TPA: substrate-binding domain-containing protein [Albitalea sp.]|uniref:substrate-binding domain-containing protein n=1 Tax=Piscinibacter sp. TaxID=1903157 RepID=UPI002ED4A75E